MKFDNDERFFNSRNLLKFLNSLNTNLHNLKLIQLGLKDSRFILKYSRTRRRFNVSPDFLNKYTDYGHRLAGYKGKAEVELNHDINCLARSIPVDILVEYILELAEGFKGNELVLHENSPNCVTLKRPIDVSEKMRLNVSVHVIGSPEDSSSD